jgi:hypothetical protein
MGLPSLTELHQYTDGVAAIVAADLAGFRSEYSAKTVDPMFVLVDASADPTVQNALGPSAAALDEQSLPENTVDALATVLTRNRIKAMVTALRNHVKSEDGGEYASLRAALTARSAIVHPLYAEAERRDSGENCFTLSSDVTTVAPPAHACIRPTRVYVGTDGSWAADTEDAQDVGTADVALFAADNDKVLIGSDRPFTQVIFGLSTLSSHDLAWAIKYWDGNAYVTVTPTDNSVGLTLNQNIKWTLPADWVRTNKDGAGNALADKAPLYYLEFTRTANTVDTPPVASVISLVPEPILNAAGDHLGVPAATPQPPLAIVRVTGNGVVVVESISAVAHERFKEPTSQIVLRALTPIASTVDLTLSYVKQDGTNTTAAQAQWSSIDALDTLAVVLSGADGLRSVRTTGNVSVNTATDGVFAVEVQDLRTPAV